MRRPDATRLQALLLEIGNLCDAAERCAEATQYNSPRADSMKKYHRTPADVARWLTRIADAHERLVLLTRDLALTAPPAVETYE